MSYEKIILVTRKTRLEELVERFNTRAQAKFYIEHSQGNFALYEREHETYYAALSGLRRGLQKVAKVQEIERSFLPNFIFSATDLVVTIGIDGLVVNTAKYLAGQPILAVNPDPAHIDGVLLPFDVAGALAAAPAVLRGQGQIRPITMAEARLNDGQHLLAFNDLFIGRHDHVSARYKIAVNGRSETHSSSGIIVSTGAGSTGWLSSVFNMAQGMLQQFGQGEAALVKPGLAWDTDKLLFVVREPFVSKTSGADIVCGLITADQPLIVESTMPEGGVIFSDGVTADYLAFNSSTIATIGLAQRQTQLIVG
jgi:NAD kinase